MTHTRPESKTGLDKSDCKGRTGARDRHWPDDRCKRELRAAEVHQKEERLPNADTKNDQELQ